MPGKAGVFINVVGTVDVAKIRDAQAALSDLAKQQGLASKSITDRMKAMSASMVATGKRLSKSVTLPILGLGVASFKAFSDAQKVSAQTRAVIKSTGGAANVTARQVDTLANSIAGYSGQDDEAIKSGANLLLTFTNIRNGVGKNNKIFDQATRTIADMSQGLGQDLKSSAIQLGKALNDPIKGVTALSRVGVSFTAGQKKQIESLVKSGKTMKAQKLILRELNKEFGGSAKAFGDTAAGRMAKLKTAIGNLGESFGQALLPFVKKAAEWLQKLVDWFQQLSPHTREMIVKIALMAAAIGPLLIILGKLVGIIRIVILTFQLLSANPIILVVAAIVAVLVLLIMNWKKVKAFLLATWEAIKHAAITAWNAILSFFKGLPGKILAIFAKAGSWLLEKGKQILHGLWSGIVAVFKLAWAWLKALPGRIIGIFADAGSWLLSAGSALAQGLWDGFVATLQSTFGVDALSELFSGDWIRHLNPLAGRAAGGPVAGGRPYVVGERGPEIFMPASSGRIIPNRQAMSNGGGWGGVNVIVHVHGNVTSERDLALAIRDQLLRVKPRLGGQLGLA